MSMYDRPCGFCKPCQDGTPSQCIFMTLGQKPISNLSATSLNGSKTKSSSYSSSCYESHPGLKITDSITVYGGSCSSPVVKDADIYVKLDRYSTSPYEWRPWNETSKQQTVSFPITDHDAPVDAKEFKRMIGWLASQATAGKKIHVGCIGGHGRTGMVLAALVKEIAGVEDAITFVRDHYCKKSVETASQSAFLHKHFGIKNVGARYKGYTEKSAINARDTWREQKSYADKYRSRVTLKDMAHPIKAMIGAKGNLWGIKQVDLG